MKIYKLKFDVNKYESFEVNEPVTAEFYQKFDGSSLKDKWKKLKVRRMEPEKRLDLGDAPGFVTPVFNVKARNVLAPLIEGHVEYLPLDLDGTEYYAVNVLTVIDAIDYEKSEYVKFSNGRIMCFEEYSFIRDKLKGINIFKIPDERRGFAFVSEAFKDAIEDNQLRGFKLECVWELHDECMHFLESRERR